MHIEMLPNTTSAGAEFSGVSHLPRQFRSAPHGLLDPNLIDITDTRHREFAGMTRQTVTLNDLLMVREKLIHDIRSRLVGKTAGFLPASQSGEPDFQLIGLPDAANLPAIQWKLLHLRRLIDKDPDKHASQSDALVNLLQSR